MDKLIVKGATPLKGRVRVAGSKNAALPIMIASLLTDETVTLRNIPHLRDVTTTLQLLSTLGTERTLHYVDDFSITLATKTIASSTPDERLVRSMRASILLLGPMLARQGHIELPYPGGCTIGDRPVNLHIEGLRAMGAVIDDSHPDKIIATTDGLKGTHIRMPKISVTGTENILCAAVTARGTTIIEGAAMEPEVTDLANFLVAMGADIEGIGTSTLTITGVPKLNGCDHTVIADRIEAATYLIAAALTRGDIEVENIEPTNIAAVLETLAETGADIQTNQSTVRLNMHNRRPKAVNVTTAEYPGFPTDTQAQLVTLNALAEGTAAIEETIFENRFRHVDELKKMGANLTLVGNTVHSEGQETLNAATMTATDLRASASLVLAALMADGTSTIESIGHIDRGYEVLEEKLGELGARIRRSHGK